MKKKLLAAAVVLTAVLMLGGCEGLSAKNAKGPETEESCLYITKDRKLKRAGNSGFRKSGKGKSSSYHLL